jgi:hypothetical protein
LPDEAPELLVRTGDPMFHSSPRQTAGTVGRIEKAIRNVTTHLLPRPRSRPRRA